MIRLVLTLLSQRRATSGDFGLPNVAADQGNLQNAFNVGFLVAGALAVIFIIVGGIQYVISAGDPQQTAQAKNTILYAVIGLVIVIFASAIVNFVIVQLT